MDSQADETLKLYALGHAPVSPDSLLPELTELSAKEFNVSMVADEVIFLSKVANSGLGVFKNTLESLPDIPDEELVDDDDDDIETKEKSAFALYCLSVYAKRMQMLAGALGEMALNTLERFGEFKMDIVKQMEVAAREGARPRSREMEEILNLTMGTKWNPPEPPTKNRTVGFKETAAVISGGRVQQEALKGQGQGEFRRKTGRNPTGYHKFNFKDLGLEDSDMESSRSRASVRGGAGSSTDGGSTRGSVSHGAGTSGSASSGGEDEYDLQGDGLTGRQGSRGSSKGSVDPAGVPEALNPFSGSRSRRSTSSVLFSFNKEREVIEDREADPGWEDQTRHERRFSRIRNRVPTGHPSLMKSTSGELATLVSEYTNQLSALSIDNETADNTETNKSLQTSATEAGADIDNGSIGSGEVVPGVEPAAAGSSGNNKKVHHDREAGSRRRSALKGAKEGKSKARVAMSGPKL